MIIIPMAGKSSRFYKEGYKKPKFMLPLGNESNVFLEAIKSFELYFLDDFFLFITREDDGSIDFVKTHCDILGIKKYEIVSVNIETRGQADTVAIGLEKVKKTESEEPIFIFNIDSIRVNFVKPRLEFIEGISGYLEVFIGEGNHWSFIEAGENDLVKRTTEKIRISELCSNGMYFFSSCKLFSDTFKQLESMNNYNEFFIAPMYNILISNGALVKYKKLEFTETLFSGTPSEYNNLKKNYI